MNRLALIPLLLLCATGCVQRTATPADVQSADSLSRSVDSLSPLVADTLAADSAVATAPAPIVALEVPVVELVAQSEQAVIHRVDSAVFYQAKARVKPQLWPAGLEAGEAQRLLEGRGFHFEKFAYKEIVESGIRDYVACELDDPDAWIYSRVYVTPDNPHYKQWAEESGLEPWLYGYSSDPQQGFCLGDDLTAYYPEQEVLVVQAGDFEICFDLRMGECDWMNPGNPGYQLVSPSGRFRTNGQYSGAAGEVNYRIERRASDEGWEYGNPLHIAGLHMTDSPFWEGDSVLFYRAWWSDDAWDNPNQGYFRLKIK